MTEKSEPGDALTALLERWRGLYDAVTDDVNNGHGTVSEQDYVRGLKTAADELDAVMASLRQQMKQDHDDAEILRHSNIVEIAVRNQTGSVGEYMKHWESRALKAEAEVASLRQPQPVESSSVAHCEGCGRDVDAVYVQRLCMA